MSRGQACIIDDRIALRVEFSEWQLQLLRLLMFRRVPFFAQRFCGRAGFGSGCYGAIGYRYSQVVTGSNMGSLTYHRSGGQVLYHGKSTG